MSRASLLLAAVFVHGVVIEIPCAVAQKAPVQTNGWVPLGQARLESMDPKKIVVGAQAGAFDKIDVAVASASLEAVELAFEFASAGPEPQNWRPESVEFRSEHQRAHVIDLADRTISAIVVRRKAAGANAIVVTISGHASGGVGFGGIARPAAPPRPVWEGWTALGDRALAAGKRVERFELAAHAAGKATFSKLGLAVESTDLEIVRVTVQLSAGPGLQRWHARPAEAFTSGETEYLLELPEPTRTIQWIEIETKRAPNAAANKLSVRALPANPSAQASRVRVESIAGVPMLPPPPPPVEQVQPKADHVWARGHYEWRSGYVWVPGHWESVRPHQQWIHAHWKMTGGRWTLVPGAWRAADQN